MVHASEQERADVQIKRKLWPQTLARIKPENLVFLDESGINTDMTCRYGRSKGKARVVDRVPLNTPRSTTLLSSIRLDGSTVPLAFEGALKKDRFLQYLRDHLIPRLRKGDYVVMDNLSSHKVEGVSELIRQAGAHLLYLPPYSPDLNPIEKMWSKIKAYFRRRKLRSRELLLEAILSAFASVTPSDCRGWFTSCGY